MENADKRCVLVWGQGKYKKSIPYNAMSNVPIMHSASLSLAYRAYATTVEALEATFYRRKHVLQFPGLRRRNNLAKHRNSLPRKMSITKKES
jgi:hypothetical protein